MPQASADAVAPADARGPMRALDLLAALLVCGAAVLLFAVHARPLGYVPLVAGVGLAALSSRILARDLGIIALGQAIISTISLEADLSDANLSGADLTEAILAGADGRPHWGKLHGLDAERLAPRYPRFDDARRVRARVDPEGRFANAYVDRVLGAVGA